MRLFITIDSMPLPDRIKQECKKSERNTMLPYAAITFGFWQTAKFYKLDPTLGTLGTLSILYIASIHMAGEKNRPTVAIAALISLAISALSAYLISKAIFFLVGVVGLVVVIILASNLRRRQIVRDFSPGLRDWPN